MIAVTESVINPLANKTDPTSLNLDFMVDAFMIYIIFNASHKNKSPDKEYKDVTLMLHCI